MNEKEKKGFNITTQALTIGYIILICIGYSVKSIFYSQFGIGIEEYLNFEEYLFIYLPIGSMFISIILLFTAFFGGLYGVGYLFFNKNILFDIDNLVKEEKKREEKNNQSRSNNKLHKILLIIKNLIIFLLLIIPLGFAIYFAFNKNISWREFSLGVIIWGAIMLLLFIISKFTFRDEKKIVWTFFSFIICFFTVVLCDQQLNKAEQILDGKAIKEVLFIMKNDTISTNKTTLYIGETKEYLFMRDITKNSNIIFKKNKIHKLNLKEVKKQ
ncbi:hypothetical protein [Tenacibaculum piscium]|uniref:hypothetical protein n=1 Tax=Tenacibaculum piscium TaxID=1458515 RepID=UPI001EFB72A2|nr:hypothetical protein [Tenacibaculum piscium]MCG8184297.1 hypothetical protein [Tenacibaculum piscium]MCG8205535.1 hypothetical protein [Tenacibaculum piscium]